MLCIIAIASRTIDEVKTVATTRIIPMHRNKGKTLSHCLTARTDYAKNPEKTHDGELVSSFACDPQTVDAEFLLFKREYKSITGRSHERDVIAYQVRQSFRPGEITPEEANRVGYEFAARFLKENHAFIVATHIDKAHIHNHIIWNSTSLDCTCKFRNFWGSTKAIQRLSDTICLEHGLSIIENPKGKGVHYGKWLGEQKQPSLRDQLRTAIDAALERKPANLEALARLLQESGVDIKAGRQLSLRGENQKRFIRLDTLGEGYSQKELTAICAGEMSAAPRKQPVFHQDENPISLLVDIQAKLQAGKSAGYERWAKKFNLKQMAQTVNYITEHGFKSYDQLSAKADEVCGRFNELSVQVKTAEKRMAEIAVLRTHILNYIKTRDVYTEYRKSGYSAKYRSTHEGEILLHQAAKKAFDAQKLDKLPTVKTLNAEYAVLLSQKKIDYAEYRNVRTNMKELLTAKANLGLLLEVKTKNVEHEKIMSL